MSRYLGGLHGHAAMVMLACCLLVLEACSSTKSRAEAPPKQDQDSRREATPLQSTSDLVRDKKGVPSVAQVGEFVNALYGYRVIIPEGMQGLSSPEPPPRHGFRIELSAEPDVDAYITVTAYGDVLFWRSLDSAVAAEVVELKKNTDSPVIKQEGRTRLDVIPAARLSFAYRKPESTQKFVGREIIAIRDHDESDIGIVYQIILVTSESRYAEDEQVFEQIVQSWRATPIGQMRE